MAWHTVCGPAVVQDPVLAVGVTVLGPLPGVGRDAVVVRIHRTVSHVLPQPALLRPLMGYTWEKHKNCK